MHEIGSEFWCGCTPLSGEGIGRYLPKDFDCKTVLCGRTALEIVILDAIRERSITSVYMPSYCCHTMIEPFLKHGITVSFYDVTVADDGFLLAFDSENSCDAVLLMDYFGFISKETAGIAAEQKAKGKLLIYDATHTVFCDNVDYSNYDYVIASFRKWLPVNAGFCAKHSVWREFPSLQPFEKYTQLRQDCFLQKAEYIAGERSDKAFLQDFAQAESWLEDDYSFYAADVDSRRVLNAVDTELLKVARRKNATVLTEGIASMRLDWLRTVYKCFAATDVPLFVPLLIDESVRNRFRQHMIAQSIYLPVHWPVSPYHSRKPDDIYQAELSCVCDQRYGEKDMERILDAIRSFSA